MNFNEVLGEELAGQVQAKISEYNSAQTDANKQANFVDLSEGKYISKFKFDDKVNGLQSQINDLQGQIGQRDTDMADLQHKLEAASADESKLTEVQQSLATLQSQYAQEKADWQKKIDDQAYEFRIRELANGIEFSSKAAKNEFIRSAIAKEFKTEGDKILGFDDYVEACKEADPTAFVTVQDSTGTGKPKLDIAMGAKGQNPSPGEVGFGFHFTGVRSKPMNE